MSAMRIMILLGAALFMAGCAKELSYDSSPGLAPASAAFDCSKTEAMERFKGVLERAGFSVEKYDESTGYILTYPLRGGQLVEFWRKDNTTAADAAYSSMQSIVRIGEFNFTDTALSGEIAVKQLSLSADANRDITNMDTMFAPAKRGVVSLDISASGETIEWLYKGRDTALENRLTANFSK